MLLLLVGLWPVGHGMAVGAQALANGGRAARPGTFDPQALDLLQKMVDAYAHLPALDQKTDFYSSMIPLTPAAINAPMPSGATSKAPASPPQNAENAGTATAGAPADTDKLMPHRVHLAFEQPNRLLLEVEDTDISTEKTTISRWISDGKTFWTYAGEKNWYTREKAPGHIRDFARLPSMNSGSLELMMIMGINPFANIKTQVDSVQLEGTETVHGVETQVVSLRMAESGQQVEVRLSIGKEDTLLRRLVTETAPILASAAPEPLPKAGDPLDELADPPKPIADPSVADALNTSSSNGAPVRTRVVYENVVTLDPKLSPQTFAYLPPENAMQYHSLGDRQQFVPLKKRFQEMVKAARKNKPKPQDLRP